jgi:uncharacterized protein YbjT (DUF2867 family)
MNITLTGSLGNTGKPLATQLVKAGHQVTVISSDAEKKAAIEAIGAKAAIGSVSDAAFLTTAFTGADAVFAMTPPALGGANIVRNTTEAGNAFAQAIKAANVKKLVMLSSTGADFPAGTGPIAGLHNIEQIYSGLQGVAITFLRAGYFYNNYYNDIPVIRAFNIINTNYPRSIRIPLVHPTDIAAIAADELQKQTSGIHVRYAVSDVKTPAEIASILGKAIGKPALPWVEATDEQFRQALTQAGLPAEMAGLYTEMGQALKDGKLSKDFTEKGSPVEGKISFEKFAEEFAQHYN